jgi:TIR domain
VSFDPSELEYYPGHVLTWAQAHSDLLDLIAEELITTGKWPRMSELTRRLAQAGNPTPVRDILLKMPRSLGFVDHQADHPVLFLFGLRLTHHGNVLLDGFVGALQLAYARYSGDGDDLSISRADVAGNDPNYTRALSEILLREAPFLTNWDGEATDGWTKQISGDIVRYANVDTPDGYLRIRAAELAASPQTGWYPVETPHPVPTVEETLDVEPESSLHASDDARDAFISHAGEDGALANQICQRLEAAGWSAWLDKVEITVGDSLFDRLNSAIANGRFGVIILSEAFFAKHWTKEELSAFAAREAASGTKIILPVWHGIDERYLAKVAPMLAHRVGVSTADGLEHVAAELIRAFERARQMPADPRHTEPVVQSVRPEIEPAPIDHVPRTAAEQERLLETKPDLWEFFLFGSSLLLGREALEEKWHAHELRLGRGPRQHFEAFDAMQYLNHAMRDFRASMKETDRAFVPDVQRRAFGAPGEPGDAARIQQLAGLVIRQYEGFMDTAAAIRKQGVPDAFEEAFELGAQMVDQPLGEIRAFIDEAVASIDQLPSRLEDQDPNAEPFRLVLELKLTSNQAVQDRFSEAMDRLTDSYEN